MPKALPARIRRAVALALSGIVAAGAALRGAPPPSHAEPDDESYERWTRATTLPIVGGIGSGTAFVAASAVKGRRGAFLQLPTRSIPEWTPSQVRAALLDADGGSLMRPADLVEAIMSDDRVQGVLSTRTHGLLGLLVQFFGEPEQVAALAGTKALEGQQAIPGDWAKMFPEQELAQLLAWGILLGVGLAERVPDDGREIGQRSAPSIIVWHPRWLRHDWSTQKWYLTTADGEIEIVPGDGRFILYTPYGSTRPWTLGAWRPISFAWVLKQFALHDRARHSEVLGSAARVGTAPNEQSGGTEPMRKRFLRDIKNMGRDNAMVLEQGWDIKMVEATGRTWEIYTSQIEWADRAIAITLAGQFVTTEGTKGFSNGNIHADIKHDLITFSAESLATCLHQQGLRPWANDNWGSADLAPWARWNTTPPKDRKETAEALLALGNAIGTLDAALAPSGMRVDAVALAGEYGVALVKLPPAMDKAPTVQLAPADLAKIVRVNEGRAAAGLSPLALPTGAPDPDGLITIAEFSTKHGIKQEVPFGQAA